MGGIKIRRISRTDFRIDFRMFRDIIVPLCKDTKVFDMKLSSRMPIEFKVLVALRILGIDNVCDTISGYLRLESLPAITFFASLS